MKTAFLVHFGGYCQFLLIIACFISSTVFVKSDAQSISGPGLRYFETASNVLNEPCVAYSGEHYAAAFNLQISGSDYSFILNKAERLSSTSSVNALPRNSRIKDCSSIIIDWWGTTRYQIFNLSLYDGQLDLQRELNVRSAANPDELEKGFTILSACPEETNDAEYLRCIGINTPKLNPEHHILIGSSDKIPSYYGDDYKQIVSWLIEMGLGYDRFVHITYEIEDDNESLLSTLRELGVNYNGELVKEIEKIDEYKSCLSAFWSAYSDRGRNQYSFCIQPNPYTDPVLEYDREIEGDAFAYRVAHGWLHEYFHHTQRAHTLERSLGTSTECCGLINPVEAPPFWTEGAAIVFPDLFLWEKFYQLNYTKRNNFERGNGAYHQADSPIICQSFDRYLCDQGRRHFRSAKKAVQNNGGRCYLGAMDGLDLYDGKIKQPQCDWGMAAYYLAYITSFQTMWVDIARDMWALGFPASFEKHVGMNINEFAESYSEFMNSGSPEDPPPAGFFPDKPLSELVNFWELQTRPSGQVVSP